MKRLATALALIPAASYLVFLAPGLVFLASALLMGFLCYSEYSGIAAAHAIRRPGIWGMVAGCLLVLEPPHTTLLLILVVLVSFGEALRRSDFRAILPELSAAFFGSLYTFAPWHSAVRLRAASVHLLFFALALNWIGDSAAFYVGRRFGRHRLAPVVSPKKSWEGAIASVLASLTFGFLYLPRFLPELRIWQIAFMAVLGNIAGQIGDLSESAMKRGAGLKDSGTLLPGHGGMLDRVDSSLFSLPVVSIIYTYLTNPN
jgi:phosphatidate cytidylyltransferase